MRLYGIRVVLQNGKQRLRSRIERSVYGSRSTFLADGVGVRVVAATSVVNVVVVVRIEIGGGGGGMMVGSGEVGRAVTSDGGQVGLGIRDRVGP